MGLFSKNQSRGKIASPEGLVNYWIFFTTNLVKIAEKNAKKAGLDIFGSPITKQGLFGLNRYHVLAIILNSTHTNNLLSANVSYPLSNTEARSIMVRLGPLWVESIYDTYTNKSYKLPPEVDILEVILVAFPTICVLVKRIDGIAEIPEDNSAEMEKEMNRFLSLIMDNKQ